ncbi:beta-ribofuranosylaminobenzene 5'-phosphate synthase family protein [Nitrincola iocasae]|nr:beta-ribofuranosylaminobenzene 5'-phosphate synthase family protein [Nitrincola iocasae]
MVSIKASARIHSGLISMHENAYRKFGSVGFSITNPYLIVNTFRCNSGIKITDERLEKITNDKIIHLLKIIEDIYRYYNINGGCEIIIEGDLFPHMGLGSGTALTLSTIESILILNNINYNDSDLIALSKRGRTSGVGIQTYFKGGAILDLGQKFNNCHWAPSSLNFATNISNLLSRIDIPDWEVNLIFPHTKNKIHSNKERDFFNKNLPLDEYESFRSSYHLIFGLFASFLDNDKKSAINSLQSINDLKWKELEITNQPASSDLLEYLKSKGINASMSSMGPTLYSFSTLKELSIKNFNYLTTKPNNQGRVLLNV